MLLETLYQIVEPIVAELGYILWGIEITGIGPLTVSIFIDHENGVSIDDCQAVSKQVSTMFDVENPISGKYFLEVSSPGINRRIFNVSQAESLIGSNVKAVSLAPIGSQTKFKGMLKKVHGNSIVILKSQDNQEISFDFDELRKLRVSSSSS